MLLNKFIILNIIFFTIIYILLLYIVYYIYFTINIILNIIYYFKIILILFENYYCNVYNVNNVNNVNNDKILFNPFLNQLPPYALSLDLTLSLQDGLLFLRLTLLLNQMLSLSGPLHLQMIFLCNY